MYSLNLGVRGLTQRTKAGLDVPSSVVRSLSLLGREKYSVMIQHSHYIGNKDWLRVIKNEGFLKSSYTTSRDDVTQKKRSVRYLSMMLPLQATQDWTMASIMFAWEGG